MLASLIFGAFMTSASATPTTINDLINYVNTPDPAFKWFDMNNTIKTKAFTLYTLNVTSQTWLTPEDFVGTNGYLWQHQVTCIVPTLLEHFGVAGIYVTGGSQEQTPPGLSSEDVEVATVLALESNTVVCSLFQVPNQDIQFANDPSHRKRGEDALVAYSWLNFINAGFDSAASKYIVNLPMTKSVSATMTAIQQWAPTINPLLKPTRFMIAGASKRGWTTWLIGASDKRVVGIAPIVMDMLNFYENVKHMPYAYGGWTFAFKDYCDAQITKYIDTPQLQALANVVDPLMYKAQLTMPKLVIDATGDEFFMPDDDYFWWGNLTGDTYRLMAQNAEHSEATGIFELLNGVHGFYDSLILGQSRPSLDWTIGDDGTIAATTNKQPKAVKLWHANTTTVNQHTRRDFRLVVGITDANPCKFVPIDLFGHNCLNPIIWEQINMTVTPAGNNFTVVAPPPPAPKDGWHGFFLQFIFPGPAKSDFIFTTQISILPKTYPFGSCHDYPGGCGNCTPYLL